MARPAKHTFTLPGGKVVGYGFTNRAGVYRVRFEGPDGKRTEETTGHTDLNKAIVKAAQIILKSFVPTEEDHPSRATWDTVLKELKSTPDLRPATTAQYGSILSAVRTLLPETKGPADITPELATRFKRLLLSTPDRYGHARQPITARTYLRELRGLWNKHFKELGFVRGNPWEEVSYPPVSKSKPVVPSTSAFENFSAWLLTRYPDWPLIHLFVRVKALAVCRTWDLCQLKAEDLVKPNKLVFPAEVIKTNDSRVIPLPADVWAELEAMSEGKTYLWEQYTEDARKFRPGTRNQATFKPSTLKWAIVNVFREYNKAFPKARVKPHDFRRRGITLTTRATKDLDGSAKALGVTAATARAYYLDAEQLSDSETILVGMAGILDTKSVKSATKSATKPGRLKADQPAE